MFPAWGPLIWPVAALIGIAIHRRVSKHPRTRVHVLEIALLYWFFFGVGVTATAAFVANGIFPDEIAPKIGFPSGNPFQFEVAMANLAIAVLGFLCLRYRGQFWEATTIAATVYLWGAAVGHIRQYIEHDNTAPYNIGPMLWTDIGVQVVLIVLLIAYRRAQRPATDTPPSESAARTGTRSRSSTPIT